MFPVCANGAPRYPALGAPDEVTMVAAALAPEFGLSTEDYWRIYAARWPWSLDDAGWMAAHALEVDRALRPDPLDAAASARTVAQLLDTADLSDREREVIARRFGLDPYPQETEDEAAASMALSPRRVRQIQAAALAKLRAAG